MRRKIVIFATASLVVLLLISIYSYIQNQPKKVVAFEGISLGESKDSVFYALGPPSTVLEPIEAGSKSRFRVLIPAADLQKLKKGPKDFDEWDYQRGRTRLDVTFDGNGHVRKIGCYQNPPYTILFDGPECVVNRIRLSTQEAEVKRVLGSPTTESIDGVSKTLTYKSLNMELIFTRKSLYYIIIGPLE